MEGVIAIDKPAGVTSFDVLRVLKRTWGERRIGHCGTLDPAATGVLIVCLGWCTRLVPWLMATSKEYVGTVQLGVRTASDDAAGDVIERCEVPPFDRERIVAELERLSGPIVQRPPNVSALRIDGVRAHERVRRGEAFEVASREVIVHECELLRLDHEGRSFEARWVVSTGTYIRSLARDIGESMGCGAHLSALRRTRAGSTRVEDCESLEAIEADPQASLARLLSPWQALGHLEVLELDTEFRQMLVHGKRPLWDGPPISGDVRVPDANGGLLAIVREFVDEEGARRLIVERVYPGAVV